MEVKMDVNQLAVQLKEALEPLAKKLGQGVEAVYAMAVKDAWITGVQNAVECLLILAFGIFGTVMLFKWANHIIKEGWDETSWLPFVLVGLAFLFFVVGAGVYCFETSLHYCLNPQYMALKDLLHAIK